MARRPNDATPPPRTDSSGTDRPAPDRPWPLNDVQPHVAPSPAPDIWPAPDATRDSTRDSTRGQSPDDMTADALRHSLDRGRGGDKTDFSDPAAAPLGTDDEAAGFPPTAEQVRMAAASELGPRPDEVAQKRRTPGALVNGGLGRWPWPLVLLAVAALVIVLMIA